MHAMKNVFNRSLGLCFVLSMVWLQAGAQFRLSGEIRPRAEYRAGYRRMPHEQEKPAAFVYQRSRLNLEFTQDRLTTYLSVQDVRSWGQDPQKVHTPSVDLHQAWVEYQPNEHWAFRAGRQELKYDNERFLAVNNWIQPAQKHDLLLIKYQKQEAALHLGAAFNQAGDQINQNMANFGTLYPVNNYKFMNYLWFHSPAGGKGQLSLLAISEGNENQMSGKLYVRSTWAAYSVWNFRHFALMVNPAFQHGRTINGQSIEAWYFRSDISYKPMNWWDARFGVEYFSGNDFTRANDHTYRAFDPTHGSGHAHNGYMDYFTNFPSHTKGAGLVNPYLYNRFALNTSTTLHIDLHAFSLSGQYIHNQNTLDRYLGTEIDLSLSRNINHYSSISMGYSMMFGTKSMEVIRGGNSGPWAHWAYVMVSVKPVFFQSGVDK